MTQEELNEVADRELMQYCQEDEAHASGYYEYIGDMRVIDQGKETDEFYRDEEFGAMSFFHTLVNGRKVHVRIHCGD